MSAAPKVLLVISDNTRRPAFSGTLKSLGCQVFTTISAENALAAIDGFHPNVILADMGIEDLKSNNFLKRLKENPKAKDTPVVSYTRLLTYKLTDPTALPKPESVPENEDPDRAYDALRDNLALVPGEVILWVEEALAKQKCPVPSVMAEAVKILKSPAAKK